MAYSSKISNGVKKIWDVKIRSSIKKEFPDDPMMQELHEVRARLSKKYKISRPKLSFRLKKTPLEKIGTR